MTANPDSFNLLNQDQLNQLNQLLNQLENSEDSTNLYLALGYITAFSLVNKPLETTDLLANLFDNQTNNSITEETIQLLTLAANQAKQGFAQDLALNPPSELSFSEQAEDLADWCSGFMLAIFNNELDEAEDLTKQQLAALPELLFPIMALSGLFNEEEEFADVVADSDLLEEFSQDLGEVLLDLYCLLHAPEEKRK